MRWITHERPKIDRIACPWLTKRFIDPAAEFVFAPPTQVIVSARELGAIPFDVEGVELSHDGLSLLKLRDCSRYGLDSRTTSLTITNSSRTAS